MATAVMAPKTVSPPRMKRGRFFLSRKSAKRVIKVYAVSMRCFRIHGNRRCFNEDLHGGQDLQARRYCGSIVLILGFQYQGDVLSFH